ncbi:MHP1 [Candida pseudojiufengensis]|uniref:MHP1 n=1 Tax=Candida pseudojiufengensis TaxID=497109 RepID=UPI002225322B|nr:MHP1 [Candida pseudojiufengensis]KAI5962625.1 MHP1 [Candida pseudojiufengensis]
MTNDLDNETSDQNMINKTASNELDRQNSNSSSIKRKNSGRNTLSKTLTNNLIEIDKIKDKLEQETDVYTKGVKDTDVDWFMRDSSMDPAFKASTANKPVENNDDTINNKSNQIPKPNSSLDTPSSPSHSVNTHLSTTISNSNETISSKSKPSITPIQEENIASNQSHDLNHHSTNEPSSSSSNNIFQKPRRKSSGGLFSKLKGKFSKEPSFSTNSVPISKHEINLFKNNYDMNHYHKPVKDPSNSPLEKKTNEQTEVSSYFDNQHHLERTASTPSNSKAVPDSRLEEYIKFYKQRDSRRPSAVSRRSSITSTGSNQSENQLPSALVNGYDNTNYQNPSLTSSSNIPPTTQAPDSNATRLTNFIKRKTSISSKQEIPTTTTTTSTSSINSSTSPNPPSTIEQDPSFKGLKPLKRVAFHSSTFLIDPPQQIPSRTPRKGNVEILSNGQVRINPLTEEDKKSIELSQMGKGGGIVVGGTGALGYIKKEDQNDEEQEEEIVQPPNDDDDQNQINSSDDPDEPAVNAHAKSIAIDKPMVHHQSAGNYYSTPVKKMALDTMYSRCCHLREILPIPAILKQIPPGSLAPLPVLQLRNPTPTMIEIQTFADFLRIAPVICVSLDGVNLSVEQFKILLSAMSAKTQLEKLSLRNTPINQEGWSLLCWFLSRNTVLNRLDISQCQSLTVNVLKKKKKKNSTTESSNKFESNLVRMTCNKDNRSDMDWSLFVATLVARGGIEDLILTGCCITNVEIFESLIELAVAKRTSRLGLAFNNLTPKHLNILVNYWLFEDFARGLDLGYNDFSSSQMLKIFIDFIKRSDFETKIQNSTITFLSFNSTNIVFNDLFKEIFEKILLKLPNLKYLDLSNNQRLFGTFNHDSDTVTTSQPNNISEADYKNSSECSRVQYFTSKFPLFPKLVRLHLENENFNSLSILQIAKVIPFCKHLGYFSLLGNHIDPTAASALINATKNSKSLINLDCNSDNFPEFFKERLGLYTMRNMERLLYTNKDENKNSNNASLSILSNVESNSNSLTEQFQEILLLKTQMKLDLSSPKVINFFKRAQSIRSQLKESIDELNNLQLKNSLDLDGKEMLIRFIFIDSSIEKGLQLIDPNYNNENSTTKANMYLMKGSEGDARDKAIEERFEDDQEQEHDKHLLQPSNSSNSIPQSRSPLVSKSNSRTNLANLDRQEGSVLKLSKLKDYHEPNSKINNMSGEEIRNKLMSIELSDLDKIIDYLGNLRDQGLSLEKVFHQNDDDNIKSESNDKNSKNLEHDLLNIEEIKSRLQQLSTNKQNDSNNQAGNDSKKDDSKKPVCFFNDEEDEEEEENSLKKHDSTINETYDEVLNKLTT